MNFQSFFAEAAKFWERKRLVYNLVLATMAVFYWGAEIVFGGPADWIGGGLVLFAFAVIANLLFSLAYVADFLIQVMPMKTYRQPARWTVFVGGLSTSCVLAWLVLAGKALA